MTISDIEKYIQGLRDLLQDQEEIDKLDIDQMKSIYLEIETWVNFVKVYHKLEK